MGIGNAVIKNENSSVIRVDDETAELLFESAKSARRSPGKFIAELIAEWRERQADRRFIEGMQRRGPSKPEDCIPWAEVKKDLGL